MSTPITYIKQDNGSFKILFNNRVNIGEFYQEMDGYYVYEPNRDKISGYWPEWMLLELGGKLKELNKPWDDQITEYFDKEEKKKRCLI